MKRILFAIVIVLLCALFGCLYSLPACRDFLLGLNAGWLTNIYANLDSFFSFLWQRSLGGYINLGASFDNAQTYGLIFVCLFTLAVIIIVEVTASIVYANHVKNQAKFEQRIKDETAKLSNSEEAPKAFKEAMPNRSALQNSSAPFVSLNKALAETGSASEQVDLAKKKSIPGVRIALSVIFGVLVLLFLFMRFVCQVELNPIYGAFSSMFSSPFWSYWMNNFDEFFSSLLKSVYLNPLATVQSSVWTVGQMLELVLVFIFCSLVWAAVLIVWHFIIKKRRAKRRSRESVNSDLKLKYADADNPYGKKADISTISSVKGMKNDEKASEADAREGYIQDIGQNVQAAGKAERVTPQVQVSPVRMALTPENIGEDLSGNKSVKVSDIVSIDDTIKKSHEAVKVDSFVMPEENVLSVDLQSVQLGTVARYDRKKPNENVNLKKDDTIVFDEDGYAYLQQSGRPFEGNLEDISDVIKEESLDKKAAISRYGKEEFEVLDKLEPFNLRPLVFGEEIDRIKNRQQLADIEESEEELQNALSEEPFNNILNGDEEFDKELLAEKKEFKPEEKTEEQKQEENEPSGYVYEVFLNETLANQAFYEQAMGEDAFAKNILITRLFEGKKEVHEEAFKEFENAPFSPLFVSDLLASYTREGPQEEKKEEKPEEPKKEEAKPFIKPAEPIKPVQPEEPKKEETEPKKEEEKPFIKPLPVNKEENAGGKPKGPIGIRPIKTIIAQPLNQSAEQSFKPKPIQPVNPEKAEEEKKEGKVFKPVEPLSMKNAYRPNKPHGPINPQHVTADQFNKGGVIGGTASGEGNVSSQPSLGFVSARPIHPSETRHIVPAFNKPMTPIVPKAVSTAGLLTPHKAAPGLSNESAANKPVFIKPLNPFNKPTPSFMRRNIRPLDPRLVHSTNGLDMHQEDVSSLPSQPETSAQVSEEKHPEPVQVKSITIEEYLGRKNKK